MGFETILKVLPVTGIEAQWVARLTCFARKEPGEFLEPDITFLEPPAGQHVPYVDPVEAMAILLRAEGIPKINAEEVATAKFKVLRQNIPLMEHPRLFENNAASVPECIPVHRFVEFLGLSGLVSRQLIGFIKSAEEHTRENCVFRHLLTGEQWHLEELPDIPPPTAMVEFFVGLPQDIAWQVDPDYEDGTWSKVLLSWRSFIRPVARHLKKSLRKEVYHFQKMDSVHDDDFCHRFLTLHYWCSMLPNSDYVKYLVEVSELPDVETLKRELINPLNYSVPFEIGGFGNTIETISCCRFKWQNHPDLSRNGVVA